jgi:hypothetical protein
MSSSIFKVCHMCCTSGVKWVFWGGGSKGQGRMRLVEMRQLILSMGLVWVEARTLAQRAKELHSMKNKA